MRFADRLKHVIEPELQRAAHYRHRGRRAGCHARQLRLRRRRRHAHDLRPDQPRAGAPGAADGPRRGAAASSRPPRAADRASRRPTTPTRAPAPTIRATAVRSPAAPASAFSPIALAVRANPTETAGVTLRAEYDARAGRAEDAAARRHARRGSWLSTSGRPQLNSMRPACSISARHRGAQLPQLAVQRDARAAPRGRRYQFYLNLSDGTLVEQRLGVFYNAQCCGVAFEDPDVRLRREPTGRGEGTIGGSTFRTRWRGLGSFSNALGAFGVGQGATGTGVR